MKHRYHFYLRLDRLDLCIDVCSVQNNLFMSNLTDSRSEKLITIDNNLISKREIREKNERHFAANLKNAVRLRLFRR